MTTITFEVPDDLAEQLGSLREHLPALLYEVLKSGSAKRTIRILQAGITHPAYREMIDFLASGPTPEQIVTHKPSAAVQERLVELLDKNREADLTEEEAAELDVYEQVDDLMSLLKARAHAAKPKPGS